ncbi:MAG: SDR family oxidoreductase, partial [Pseudomonadota bacterium]
DTPILDGTAKAAQLDKDVLMDKLARQIPLKFVGEPNDIANAVVYLASDESRFMTGAEIKLDGGISAM